jgi:hypothetical protein
MANPEEILRKRLDRESAAAQTAETAAHATAAAGIEALRRDAAISTRASIESLAGYEYYAAEIIRPAIKTEGLFRTKTETRERVAWKLLSEKEFYIDGDLEIPVWFGVDQIVYREQILGRGWTATSLAEESEQVCKEARNYLAHLVVLLEARGRNKELDRAISAKYGLDHAQVVAKLDVVLEVIKPYPVRKTEAPTVDTADLVRLRVREKAAHAWLDHGTQPPERETI